MDHATTVRLLVSGNARQRLAAARVFQRDASREDLPLLREALAREEVAWIRSALEDAIQKGERIRRGGRVAPRQPSLAADAAPEANRTELAAEIRDEAIHQNSLMVVHILDPIVGSLRVYAGQEVPDFENSRTARTLGQLMGMLQSIQRLGQASAPPKLAETRISELLTRLRDTEFANELDQIELRGADDAQWLTDPTLVGLILGVALRNAVEAAKEPERDHVVCEWQTEPASLVIRVMDDGPGPAGEVAVLFDVGVSTKSGHSGLGLAIARQAARSLGASIDLLPRDTGGSVFELVLPTLNGGAASANPRD